MEIKNLIKKINAAALQSKRQRITGRNQIVNNLFTYLHRSFCLQQDFLLLCTKKGLILSCFAPGLNENLSGYTLNTEDIDVKKSLRLTPVLDNYIVFSEQDVSPVTVQKLTENLEALVGIFDEGNANDRNLLNCLDAVRNSISIYDNEANLLYGNKNFFKYLHVKDPRAAIGMNINEIMKESGLKVHSMSNNAEHLKMMDVLKTGKEALDWEVRLEFEKTPNAAQMASNDLYPVIGKNGAVEGMVELARSHSQDMKRTRNILGLTAEYTFDDILGRSSLIHEKIEQAKEFANSPFNFLITGESGVGKELFAQSIHNYSVRKNGPFVALNCASFPENLIESELFGYVGGAFTGASKNGQTGKFELANGGTLFLDEIGELPLHFQSKLLRVLETWTVTRIGSTRPIPVNVRLIAATNRNLEEMVEAGLFRQDLYYRLQVLNVEIPPLRDRKEDLLLLAENFLTHSMNAQDGSVKTLAPDAQRVLIGYDWPGNIRELKNVINRVSILSKSDIISKSIVEAAIYSKGYMLNHSSDESPDERINKRKMEVDVSNANLLKEALDITGGNKMKAAELLGISRKTLYRMIEKYM